MVVDYNTTLESIENVDGEDGLWTFKLIVEHKAVSPKDKDYRGSAYNLKVLWENGECAWTALSDIHNKPFLAEYGRQHNLLDKPG